VTVRAAQVDVLAEGWRLIRNPGEPGKYNNAQIDDYRTLARRDFAWRAPLQFALSARFSHPASELCGTAGFGFWNDPILMTGWRMPTLPRAIWFLFASPPSDMPFALDVPGWGWKAAVIDALHAPAMAALPAAPLVALLCRWQRAYRALWPLAQRTLRVAEAGLSVDLTQWHDYAITWKQELATFAVDGEQILSTRYAPRGRLGLVIWIDNQYMIATPHGRLRHGVITAGETQWMEVRNLAIGSTLQR
jgi:hypothetical protein